MKPEASCVILFPSIHDVVAAERRLRAASLWCDMVPTPRQLSSDCGMSLACRCEDLEAIRGALLGSPIEVSGIYQEIDRSFQPMA